MQLTDAIRAQLQHLWDTATVGDAHKGELLTFCQKLIANRSRYEAVSKQTGVPWCFIASVHMRESDCNFSTYLGNGDPLNRKTVHVPAGRGPWSSWESGAIDALRLESLDKITAWDIPTLLWHLELYNGMGYRNHGLPSPYVWSFTNVYTSGKYTADGVFDPYAVDRQAGCAAILIELFQLLSTQPMEAPMTATTPVSVPSLPVAASNTIDLGSILSGVVDSAKVSATSVWASIAGMFSTGAVGGTLIYKIIQTFDPGLLTYATAGATLAATVIGVAANAYHLVTHMNATNSSTVSLSEKWLNGLQVTLGLPVTDFTADNNGGSLPAATA